MMSSRKPTVFFIGVGNMGNPMAANLIRAGYPLWVHDLAPEKAKNLLQMGATWSTTVAQGCDQADVIMASLPGPAQVREEIGRAHV